MQLSCAALKTAWMIELWIAFPRVLKYSSLLFNKCSQPLMFTLHCLPESAYYRKHFNGRWFFSPQWVTSNYTDTEDVETGKSLNWQIRVMHNLTTSILGIVLCGKMTFHLKKKRYLQTWKINQLFIFWMINNPLLFQIDFQVEVHAGIGNLAPDVFERLYSRI